MAVVEVRNLSFAYPPEQPGQSSERVLDGVSFEVPEGAFCVLTGPTGCGKSTLLRLLKPQISPRGACEGSVSVVGMPLMVDGVRQPGASDALAAAVGFVAQDPEAQVVCDSVRAELAFGLENLGVEPQLMRRRIAEATGFLGIDSWMERRTAELSGGQKQLLNLAAVLAMRPRILLLDEPTAQLDPHARHRFLDALATVHRHLHCTIIMSSHAPEFVKPYTTHRIELGPLPAARPYDESLRLASAPTPAASNGQTEGAVIRIEEVDLRYSRETPWVLRDATVALSRGRIHAFLGGNGCGKTTLLKVFAGICKPQHGKVKASGGLRRAYLPQDPKALFACDSVGEELHEWHARFGYGRAEEQDTAERFGLAGMLGRHPYDLSGGQQQQLALAKLLLARPDLLLLDEPTKGLDASAAAWQTKLVRQIADEGACVAVATHDVPFVRLVADDVSLVFDGGVACTLPAEEYFAQSLEYRVDAPARLFGALA